MLAEPQRIIQIAVSPGNEDSSDMLYALCSDGTLWTKYMSGGTEKWKSQDTPRDQWIDNGGEEDDV